MKLYLEQKFSILNSPPEITPLQHNTMFIYYSNKNVVVSDLLSGRITHKFKYDDVTAMAIQNDSLYIFNSDIHILNLSSFEIVNIVRLSKALICKVALFKDFVLIAKANKKITLLKIEEATSRKVFEVTTEIVSDGIFLGEHFYGCYDSENVFIYSGGVKIEHFESENIISVYGDREVYAVHSDGTLVDVFSNVKIDVGRAIDGCYFYNYELFCISDELLIKVDYSGKVKEDINIISEIKKYSGDVEDYYRGAKEMGLFKDLNRTKRVKRREDSEISSIIEKGDSEISSIIEKGDSDISSIIEKGDSEISSIIEKGDSEISSIIENEEDSIEESLEEDTNMDDSAVSLDNSLGNDSDNGEDNNSDNDSIDISDNTQEITNKINMTFTIINPNTIKTSENDYLFFSDGKIVNIVSFADDTTDAAHFKDNLILTTTSGYLKLTSTDKYIDGEYLLNTKLIKVHKDSITACKVSKDILLTGSKDKRVGIFLLSADKPVKFTKVFEFDCFKSEIISIAYRAGILAVATADLLLHIFRSEDTIHELKDVSSYFNSFERDHVLKPHTKSINHISLTDSLIITASSDKTVKIFDYGCVLKSTIQSDKVLHTSFSDDFIAICSHKGVKVIKKQGFSPVCSFQAKRPVISSSFYDGYLLAMSDVLRVYDMEKKKCVKSYNFEVENGWTFIFPFICGENKIVGLKDESGSRAQAERSLMVELAQNAMLLERYLHEKRFDEAIKVLLKRGDDRGVYQTMSRGYFSEGKVDFLDDLMKNGENKGRILDILMKNSGLKQSLVFNVILERYFLGRLDKGKKGGVRRIVERHVEAIDEIFIDLLGIGEL